MTADTMSKACYTCKHLRAIPGDCHIGCSNLIADVKGNAHGKQQGWFAWPINFDPVWLEECNGYKRKPK